MRVLVCGGRDFADRDAVWRELDALAPSFVIEGGARGADAHARAWWKSGRAPGQTFAADWKKFKKAAGPIRNQQMLDEGKPDLVLAFPGGRGRDRPAGIRPARWPMSAARDICPTCEHEAELVVYEIAEWFREVERDHGQNLPAHRTGCKECAAIFSGADPLKPVLPPDGDGERA